MAASDFVKVNNMNIVFDTDEEEKIISFDLDNMERIILNLLSNAIKYGSDNGKIEVTINCTKDVRISVKDNGIGIPKDKQNRVFERFGQVKNKMHTEWEGSGIGLFLVKSLVELNGGEIILNSELGKGIEFIIVLPDKIENNEITNEEIIYVDDLDDDYLYINKNNQEEINEKEEVKEEKKSKISIDDIINGQKAKKMEKLQRVGRPGTITVTI